jgi:hypothetical protein
MARKKRWRITPDPAQVSDALVEALEQFEKPPTNLKFREGSPVVYHPGDRMLSSGCSSSSSWEVIDVNRDRTTL